MLVAADIYRPAAIEQLKILGGQVNVDVYSEPENKNAVSIVENAIKFGLYDTVGEISITISARAENKMLYIEVKNPFDPATSLPRRGTGFGLSSVQRRLYLLYLRNDLLSTAQHENLFTTTIKIPQTV